MDRQRSKVQQCRLTRCACDSGSSTRLRISTEKHTWLFDYFCAKNAPPTSGCIYCPFEQHGPLDCRRFWSNISSVEAAIYLELDEEPDMREKVIDTLKRAHDLYLSDRLAGSY